jgi:hypothetical protein
MIETLGGIGEVDRSSFSPGRWARLPGWRLLADGSTWRARLVWCEEEAVKRRRVVDLEKRPCILCDGASDDSSGICHRCANSGIDPQMREVWAEGITEPEKQEVLRGECSEQQRQNLEEVFAQHPEVGAAVQALGGLEPAMKAARVLEQLLNRARFQGELTAREAERVATQAARCVRARAEAPESRHVGQRGWVIEGAATVLSADSIDTEFGFRTLVRLLGDEGDLLLWYSKHGLAEGVGIGDEVEIEGSVRRHGEYAGVKHTVVRIDWMRCVDGT